MSIVGPYSPVATQRYSGNAPFPQQAAPTQTSFMQPNSAGSSQQSQSQPYSAYSQAANNASNVYQTDQMNQIRQLEASLPRTNDPSDMKVRTDICDLLETIGQTTGQMQDQAAAALGPKMEKVIGDVEAPLTPGARAVIDNALQTGNMTNLAGRVQQVQQAKNGRPVGPNSLIVLDLMGKAMSPNGPTNAPSPPGGGYGTNVAQQYPSNREFSVYG